MQQTLYKPITVQREYHCHPLVKILFEKCVEQAMSPKEVATRAGFGDDALLYKWRSINMPKLDSIEACFNVLGYTLRPIRKVDEK